MEGVTLWDLSPGFLWFSITGISVYILFMCTIQPEVELPQDNQLALPYHRENYLTYLVSQGPKGI